MSAALERLAAATSGTYEIQHIEGARGVRFPIYRVGMDFVLARHASKFSPERLLGSAGFDSKATPAESPEKLAEQIQAMTEAFFGDFLDVAIDIINAGCPDLAGRIHADRVPEDEHGQPLLGHFSAPALGLDLVDLAGAIIELSRPAPAEPAAAAADTTSGAAPSKPTRQRRRKAEARGAA
jgi:hypothetical protein